jgi:MFS family permease
MPQDNLKAIMALLFVGVLMGALDLAVIGPALPAIQGEFALDNRALSWLFNVYVLAQLIGTPLFAKASDRYGRRAVYMACVAAFGLGSLLLVVAADYETLLVGRTVQGLGASGIFPVAAAVIGDSFPREKQGGALGLIGAVFGLAFLIGPVLGGILLRYSWEWLFLINLPIAAGLLLGAWRLLPGARDGEQLPFDWAGGCLLTLALLGVAVGITNLDTGRIAASLASWSVGPFLLAGATLLPVFWRVEQRAADPIVRPSFFAGRQIRMVMLIAAGIGMVECAQVFFPALGVAALGVSESTAAWLMLPGVFVMVLVSPLAGRLVDAIGAARVIQVSLAVVLAGLLVYALADINYATFIGGGMIVGVGIAALLGAPLRYVVLEEARPEDRASTQGLLNIFLAIGQLTGAAIVGAVATSAGGGTGGYQASLAVLAAITLVMALPALSLQQKRAG